MFASNRKISRRQLTRLFVFDIVGIGTLLLPSVLAKTAGNLGILCILVATGILWLVLRCEEKRRKYHTVREKKRQSHGVTMVVSMVIFLGLGAYSLYTLTSMVQYALLRQESYLVILITTLALAAYSVWAGLESRARGYEILYWILLVPLVVALLWAVRDMDSLWLEQGNIWGINQEVGLSQGIFRFLIGTLWVLLLYGILGLGKYLQNYVDEPKMIYQGARQALYRSSGLLLGSYIVLLGIFGAPALADMRYPMITLMSMIQLPGNFMGRQDALMVGVWYFMIFALLSGSIFFLDVQIKTCLELFEKKEEEKNTGNAVKRKNWKRGSWVLSAITTGVVTLLLFLVLPSDADLSSANGRGREVEERQYPLAMLVDYEDGFQVTLGFENLAEVANENAEAEEKTPLMQEGSTWNDVIEEIELSTPDSIDYGHLKAIVIGTDLLQNNRAMNEFLDACWRQETFARNTVVYVYDGAWDALLEAEEGLQMSLGVWLEEWAEKKTQKYNKNMVNLGQMLNESKNHWTTLEIPLVTVGESGITCKSSVSYHSLCE